MDKDYTLVPTHELRTNDLVLVRGAVLRIYDHKVTKDKHFFDQHSFKTEVADVGEWPFAQKELRDLHVVGNHLDLWARVK